MTKIVCISDTHTAHYKLKVPDGDILIHAGDFTNHGEQQDIINFATWLRSLPHKTKIVVPGNHDIMFERNESFARELLNDSCHLLICQSMESHGLTFYGTPWSPDFFPHHWVFNHAQESIHAKRIHEDIMDIYPDVIISHSPPFGYLDGCPDLDNPFEEVHVGCKVMLRTIEELQPKLFVCGHIHEGYGTAKIGRTHIINASCMTGRYRLENKPIIIEV